jgi:hypothetical protein
VTDGEPQQIPDLWVPLAKLAWWIRHIYGLEGGDVSRYVVLALRRGPHLRIMWPDHGPRIVQGGEWDKLLRPRNVAANWEAGHLVISDPDTLDNPLQFSIEAEWEAVIDAVSDWERQQRNKAAFAARAAARDSVSTATYSEAPPEPAPSPRRRGGGRRPKYNWPHVSVKLILRLQEDGVPAEGDGGQAELERYAAGLFPPDDCPAPSAIREWVSAIIEEYRRELG